ncbi:MAG: Dabb family protein [Eubacteriales bacterium]
MVRHIVAWNFKKNFTSEQNRENAAKAKEKLEALTDKIGEIVSLKVDINPLKTSTCDIVLTSLFENEKTLASYIIHPEHQRVRDFVNTILENKQCIDIYE